MWQKLHMKQIEYETSYFPNSTQDYQEPAPKETK